MGIKFMIINLSPKDIVGLSDKLVSFERYLVQVNAMLPLDMWMSLDVSILQTRIGTIAISPLIQRFQSGSRVAVAVSEGGATLGLGCSLALAVLSVGLDVDILGLVVILLAHVAVAVLRLVLRQPIRSQYCGN